MGEVLCFWGRGNGEGREGGVEKWVCDVMLCDVCDVGLLVKERTHYR